MTVRTRLLCSALAAVLVVAAAEAAQAQISCTATIRLDDAVTLGALELDVAYPVPDAAFDGSGSSVSCTNLSSALASFDDDDAGTLSAAFIAFGGGFSGPADLAVCNMTNQVPITESDLVVTVVDASDPDTNPVPDPAISIALFCDGDTTTTTTPPTTTTTTLPPGQVCYVQVDMTDPVTVGSIQVDVDYTAADGGFDGSGDEVNCSTLVSNSLGSYFDDEPSRVVSAAIINLNGFTGPQPLFECLFLPGAILPVPSDFALTVTDASDPDLTPIVPPPAVAVAPIDCFDPSATTTSTTSTTTSSTTSTTVSVCGNGVLENGEECDDGNLDDGDGCSSTCTTEVLCGDADANEIITAADGQRILQASVGLISECPLDVCDASGNGTLTVADAQRVLQYAVGLPVELLCP